MRKSTLIIMAAFVLASGWAVADTMVVDGIAAMEGTYGLHIEHDNSSVVEVRDDTPDGEPLYRAEFLFNAKQVTTSANYRQPIFYATSLNPNGNPDTCPGLTYVTGFRLFHQAYGGSGQLSSLLLWGTGDWCGERSAPGIVINRNQEYRVCMEWKAGGSNTGYIALAAVDPASSCPASGDAAYHTRALSNAGVAIEFVEMGIPRTNLMGANETSTLYFDSFASYRTIAP